MNEPAQLIDDRTAIVQKLRAKLDRFEFDRGAVLIQVPQVPLPFIRSEVARNKGYFAYPPSCLLYLGVTFRNLGIPCRMLDLNYEILKAAQNDDVDLEVAMQGAIDDALGAFETPLVCVSLMFDSTYPQFRAVCQQVRERNPTACIAAGGVAATADPARVLEDGLPTSYFCVRQSMHCRCFTPSYAGRPRKLHPTSHLQMKANGFLRDHPQLVANSTLIFVMSMTGFQSPTTTILDH